MDDEQSSAGHGRHKTPSKRTVHHPRRLRDLFRLVVTDRQFISAHGALPSEGELMVEFGASRTSVRSALALLVEEGHLERRRGQGTSRVAAYPIYDMAIPRREDFDVFRRNAAGVVPHLLHRSWVTAPTPVAHRLSGVVPGDSCLAIEYVLVDRLEPIAVITNYVRAAEGMEVATLPFVTDFYTFLFDAGVDIADQATTLQARPADTEVAPLLEVELGDPVLGFEQEIRNSSGEVINVALGVFRGDIRVTSSNFIYSSHH